MRNAVKKNVSKWWRMMTHNDSWFILAYLCEAPILIGYDENNEGIPAEPIYPNGPINPEPTPSDGGGVGGEVVGILFGVIIGLMFVAYGMFYLGKQKGVKLGVVAGTVNAIGSTMATG